MARFKKRRVKKTLVARPVLTLAKKAKLVTGATQSLIRMPRETTQRARRDNKARLRAIFETVYRPKLTKKLLRPAEIKLAALQQKAPKTVCSRRAERKAVLLSIGKVSRSGGAPGPYKRTKESEKACK